MLGLRSLPFDVEVSLEDEWLRLHEVKELDFEESIPDGPEARLHSCGIAHRNQTQERKLEEPYLYFTMQGTYKFWHYFNASFPMRSDVYADRVTLPQELQANLTAYFNSTEFCSAETKGPILCDCEEQIQLILELQPDSLFALDIPLIRSSAQCELGLAFAGDALVLN